MKNWEMAQWLVAVYLTLKAWPRSDQSTEDASIDLLKALCLCSLLGWGGFWS